MGKNKHAKALGKLGGQATARKLTAEERQANARHAAMTRWEAMRTAKQQSCQVDGTDENKV